MGRESTLATSISHPNVVQTYHISTMTAAQRSALANNWLAETSSGAAKPGGSGSPQQTQQQEGEDSSSDDNSRSSIEAQQKNLLVSWRRLHFSGWMTCTLRQCSHICSCNTCPKLSIEECCAASFLCWLERQPDAAKRRHG